MISEFIKEQKRYSKDDLKTMFNCSDADIIRIIKKLKDYSILKTVKNTYEQLNMSDLAEENVEVVDENEFSSKYLYVFKFVGIIIVEGMVLKCYPKYLFKSQEPIEELKQVIKVLQKYNSQEQIIRLYNDGSKTTDFNRLAIIIYLLNDYFENGIYTDTQEIIETNGMGEIYWDRTINNTYPIISNNRPYYVELQTKRRINDETDFFKQLHECILTLCSKALREADLLELFDMEGVDLSSNLLSDFGEDDYILYRLEKEMNIVFNTRKQTILKTIESLVASRCSIDDLDSFSMFGTNCFNLVWEKVCADVMDNQLHTSVNSLGLSGEVKIPESSACSSEDDLVSIIEKPKWVGCTEKGEKFEKEAEKTLIPDLISIYKRATGLTFVIFDAKYYTMQFEMTKKLQGQPGVSDVTKQYLYQLAYKEFINLNHFNYVKNCFLMPTEEDGIIKKGFVKMDMFAALQLEPIQIIQVSAKKIFAYYLANLKLDIGKLDL